MASGARGVRLCIAAWTHRGRDADCPPTGPVAHGQRFQSRLSGALWRPSIARRSPTSGTSDNSFFDDAGRKTLWSGNIRTATATRRFSCQVRYTSTRPSRTSRTVLAGAVPSFGGPLGIGRWGWEPTLWRSYPISSPGARRVPRRSTSEQSIAPIPRIHEMDRRCADAVSGIGGSGSSGTETAFQLASSAIAGSRSGRSAHACVAVKSPFVPKGSRPQNDTVPECLTQP